MLWVLPLALLLSACSSFGSLTDQGPDVRRTSTEITIYRDNGGKLGNYYMDFIAASKTDQRVRLDGDCVSACTMILGLGDRVCATPHARLGFHKVREADGRTISTGGTAMLRAMYPSSVQAWFDTHVTDDPNPVYMTSAEVSHYVRSCR